MRPGLLFFLVWVIRSGCLTLNLLVCGLIALGPVSYMHRSIAEILWVLAGMVGIVVSLHPPQQRLRHVVALGIVVLGACCAVAFTAVPPLLLFVYAWPLFASLVVLEGPSILRTLWPQ